MARLQYDYFALTAWLNFSPFMCDMRSLALLQDSDVIRYPSFVIIFGKSNYGKTSLVHTLMTSMFGYANTVEKQSFTTARLRGLQQGYKRFPVVFDDIGRNHLQSPRQGHDQGRDDTSRHGVPRVHSLRECGATVIPGRGGEAQHDDIYDHGVATTQRRVASATTEQDTGDAPWANGTSLPSLLIKSHGSSRR